MIGKILNNRYEIIEKIGDGGTAEVYRAHCKILNRFVAIKVLKQSYVNDQEFIKKFKRESLSAASLNHPNVVNVYDIGEEVIDNRLYHYIVMEYIDGPTLKDIIRAKGRLPEKVVLNYAIQIASGLQHAHNHHIIHRDIKPQNILMTKDGILKVTDFGIARATTSQTITATNEALGSVHYFSPEQAKGQLTNEQSDIYSLGIVMYEMVTGKLPFDGDTPVAVGLMHLQGEYELPSRWAPNMSKSLEKIIVKCMQKSQTNRYASMGALLKDLYFLQENGLETHIDRDYFDDTKTQVIPIIQESNKKQVQSRERAQSAPRKSKNVKKRSRKESKKNSLMTFLGILTALILVIGLFFVYQRILSAPQAARDVKVPKIIGRDSVEAAAKLEEVGLYMEIESTVINEDYEPNQIVSINNTHEGNKVKKGFTVKVSVNSDEELIELPDFKEKNLEEVLTVIVETDGLEKGEIVYEESEDLEKDIVISQYPTPGTKVPKGTSIDLKVSKGNIEVKMPNLVSHSLEDAIAQMNALGLLIETKEEESDTYEKGIITWQEIQPGMELEKNTTVLLYVSSGKVETSNSIIEEGESFSYLYTIKPNPSTEFYHIVIIKELRNGDKEIEFEKVVYYDDDTVNYELKGLEGEKFKVYIDDELKEVIP